MVQEINDYEVESDYTTLTMDELDKNILELLSTDGRKSYRKISRDLGVSVGTIHNRVDKLTKTGIISKFVPVLNHEKLGYNLTAIIGLEIKGGTVAHIIEKEQFKNNLLAVYEVTGQFDGFIIAKFKNTFELNKFIKLLLQEECVTKTYTQTVLNIVKEELNATVMNFED
ncbi:MAG: AsnC family transcriptional regulator [Methanosphaera sp. rholeuAM270]|nr:MAG: AsnC family transcriptional regulator [Methanosphaera sp. rholeuAM270]